MTHPHLTLTGMPRMTPRVAWIAGILFAILFTTSVVLIRLSLPVASSDGSSWSEMDTKLIRPALSLMPFAGIAFLWFVGVVRDRLGAFEDQFFSTVFYGSGLLFLAMIFAASAIAGGIVASYSSDPVGFTASETYLFGRLIMSQFFTIYALRMAGVFVISLGTIWFPTGLMPRWLSFITYFFAIILIRGDARVGEHLCYRKQLGLSRCRKQDDDRQRGSQKIARRIKRSNCQEISNERGRRSVKNWSNGVMEKWSNGKQKKKK